MGYICNLTGWKKTILLATTLLATGAGYAQHGKAPGGAFAGHSNMLSMLLGSNEHAAYAMKATGVTKNRVIAQSTWDNTLGTKSDSVNLGYSGSHNSAYDYNTMLYPYNYAYNSSPVFNNNAGIFSKPQVQYDTLTRWIINPNTLMYGYYETAYANYDANTSLVSFLELFADSVSYPNMRYFNKFNSAKNIDTGLGCIWKGGMNDSAFRQFYAYNASNKITADSTYEYHLGVWRIASKSYYTYNSSNDLIQIDNYANTTDTSFLQPLKQQYKYVNTYDASHRLLSVASDYNNGTSLLPYIRDTFEYQGTLTYHSKWREYQYDPINAYWAPMFNMYKIINATSNLPDTVNINSFDSLANKWVPMTRDVMSYDTAGNPVKLKDYEYSFTYFPTTPDFTTYYYYGKYVNNVGVNPEPLTENKVVVFPNPATGNITISGLTIQAGTEVAVGFVSMDGRLLQRCGMPARERLNVSVAGLLPGVYQMIVQDAAGNVLHRAPVVKQ